MAGRRRGNGEGTIRKRADGRWEARVTLEQGEQHSYYAKTREDARRKMVAAQRARDIGLPIVGERQTVAQYLTQWLDAVRPTVKPKTYRSYEQLVRVHLLPALGTHALVRLTPQRIQALWADRLQHGLSPTTVRHLHAVLHAALDNALRLGLVQRNVAELVDPPRASHREMHVLTPAQVRTLLEAARGDPLEALYVLALATGMRQGELLALHWRDVDLEAGILQVRFTLQAVPGQVPQCVEPKTRRSRRRITLPAMAVDALRAHRARQLSLRLQAGAAWQDADFVFTNSVGRPVDAGHLLKRRLYPLLARAGLPKVRFHDLRHTAATLLLLQGINPKVVSELLGHSAVSITLDLYSHVLPDMQQQAADAMQRVLAAD